MSDKKDMHPIEITIGKFDDLIRKEAAAHIIADLVSLHMYKDVNGEAESADSTIYKILDVLIHFGLFGKE